MTVRIGVSGKVLGLGKPNGVDVLDGRSARIIGVDGTPEYLWRIERVSLCGNARAVES